MFAGLNHEGHEEIEDHEDSVFQGVLFEPFDPFVPSWFKPVEVA